LACDTYIQDKVEHDKKIHQGILYFRIAPGFARGGPQYMRCQAPQVMTIYEYIGRPLLEAVEWIQSEFNSNLNAWMPFENNQELIAQQDTKDNTYWHPDQSSLDSSLNKLTLVLF